MQTQYNKFVNLSKPGAPLLVPANIIRLQAKSNYTEIFFIDKRKTLYAKVLKNFAQMLKPYGFVRTHRAHLVNRKYTASITSVGNIRMIDASEAVVSRRFKKEVMDELGGRII